MLFSCAVKRCDMLSLAFHTLSAAFLSSGLWLLHARIAGVSADGDCR